MIFATSSSSLFLFVVLLVNIANAFHDSLNFVLAPKTRQCFFENFEATSPTRTIEAFVQSGGNADVWLTIHGPLGLQEIRDVIHILQLIYSHCLKYFVLLFLSYITLGKF